MRYASEDFVSNMFGRYTPASQMVRNRARMAQEEVESRMAKEADGDHDCGCKK
jgi:hypothetical protein